MNINTKSLVKDQLQKLVVRAILIIFLILTLFPFIWDLYSSLKTNTEFMANPFALPTTLHWENYASALRSGAIGRNVWNSLYVVVVSLLITLVCSIPCSYCLVRYRFIGSSLILGTFMTCLFITGNYIIIPLFLQMNKLHILNNLTGLALVYSAFRIPYSVYLLTGYMKSIPHDYEEAAILDGCTSFDVLRRIIIPLTKPGILTVIMLTVMYSWNEYALALVLVMDPKKQTLPVGLASLSQMQQYATDWVTLFAALAIAFIPTLIIYAISKKQLLEGVNAGGIKG